MYTFHSKKDLQEFIKNEIINTSETIEILGCTRQNLHDLVRRGVLNPIKEMVRDRLFFKEDVLERKHYMENK